MPTYEHVIDGQVVERSTTIADHPSGFDEQMAALAARPGSGWRRVDENPQPSTVAATRLATGEELLQDPAPRGFEVAEPVGPGMAAPQDNPPDAVEPPPTPPGAVVQPTPDYVEEN